MDTGKRMLDMNVFSYFLKNHEISRLYLRHVKDKILYLSFITVGELFLWAEDSGWGAKRRATLDEKLRNYIVVPYDHEIARSYGRIAAERKRRGRAISLNDAWIAACPVRHAVPLVTHNAKDFAGISALQIITENSPE